MWPCQVLRAWSTLDLLVIDEVGDVPMDNTAGHHLFSVVSAGCLARELAMERTTPTTDACRRQECWLSVNRHHKLRTRRTGPVDHGPRGPADCPTFT